MGAVKIIFIGEYLSYISKYGALDSVSSLPILFQNNCSTQIEWKGPQDFEDLGLNEIKGFNSFLGFEIPALPDFSSSRFQDLQKLSEEERIQKIINRQLIFLNSLHNICFQTNSSLSIRFYYSPGKFGRKIKIYFLSNTFQPEIEITSKMAQQIFQEIKSIFAHEYFRIIDLSLSTLEELVELSWVNCITEIIKKEELNQPLYPNLAPIPFWYYPILFKPKFNSFTSLFETILSQESNILIDLTLIPTKISLVEQQLLPPLILELDKWGKGYVFDDERRSSVTQFRNPTNTDFYDYTRKERSERLESDIHALNAAKIFSSLLESYCQSPIFLYGIRVLSDNFSSNIIVSDALATSVFSGSYQKNEVEDNNKIFHALLESIKTMRVNPFVSNIKFWEHAKAPRKLMRLHRLVELKEAISFFHLPIPSYEGIAGVELDSGLKESEKSQTKKNEVINLGIFARRGVTTKEPADFHLNALSKHALIVGVPGSGKTTTCFHLLDQLWRIFQIPFIAIEPAKTEYRALKTVPGLEGILIFTVGDERVSPFRFNPFEVLDGVELERHISNLNACFSGAWDLSGPLQIFFDKAIREIYYDKGWTDFDVGGDDNTLQFPTMDDFYEKYSELVEKAGYDSEVKNNLRTAGAVRIDSFRRGSKGRMLNSRYSIPINILMEQPIVLELDSLNDEDRALMTMFILTTVREYATAKRKSGSTLKHVLLVEEAHNIIGNISAGRSTDSANPKLKAINYFVGMLAEMRALGEGIIIADQLPSALAPEAVKNTNIKIMHRLTSEDDRKTLGISMTITAEQFSQTATLSPGESFIFMEGWPNARHVLEPNYKDEHQVGEPPDKDQVQKLMQYFHESHAEIYRLFNECRIICSRCDQRVRARAERYISQSDNKLTSLFQELKNNKAVQSTGICPFILFITTEQSKEDSLFHFCVYCHLLNHKSKARKICKESFSCTCPLDKHQFAKQLIEAKLRRKINL